MFFLLKFLSSNLDEMAKLIYLISTEFYGDDEPDHVVHKPIVAVRRDLVDEQMEKLKSKKALDFVALCDHIRELCWLFEGMSLAPHVLELVLFLVLHAMVISYIILRNF